LQELKIKMKNIIITGTSSGVGLELCKFFSKAGHSIYAISRNIENLKKLKLSNVKCFSVDISDKTAIQKFYNNLKKEKVSIDILINNAGCLEKLPFSKTTYDIFKQVFAVNVLGLAELTRQLLFLMPTGGHVVNISSIGGIQGSLKFAGLSAYSSSKSAVNCLTELWAEEYKEKGIAFNALAFGSIATEMFKKAFPKFKAAIQSKDAALYIMEFALNGNNLYNGKILPISISTP